MSHELATIDGEVAMMAVGEKGERDTVWHRLGQRVPETINKVEAMKSAHLDWKVIKVQNQALAPNGDLVNVDSFSAFRDIDNYLLASNLGEGYTIKQPIDCFEFADSLIEASNGAHYNAAGALFGGRSIWLSARIPSGDIAIIGTSDKQEANLVFSTSFDGSLAHTAYISFIRPVCFNTLRAGLSSASGILRIKHTKNADIRFEQARVAMQGVIKDAKNMSDMLNALAKKDLNNEKVMQVLTTIFPKPDKQKVATRRDNIMAEVIGLFESNDNNTIPEIRGSAYNLLNAVTEYVDHFRTVRLTAEREGYSEAQARAENAVQGSGETLKDNALAAILAVSELAMAATA